MDISFISSTRSLLAITVFASPFCLANLQDAPDIPPEVQVEVIIFSQQDFFQAELPRRDITMNYPANWLYLLDQVQDVTEAQPVDIEYIQQNCVPDPGRFEQFKTEAAPYPAETLETNSAVADSVVDSANQAEGSLNIVAGESLTEQEPAIEPSFIMLDKEQRNLNPDAYTLNRSPGYRVLFHQAWRQPKLAEKNAPWVITLDGEKFDDQYELQGSIRLFQSRFPHFQANIWKTRFVSADAISSQLTTLPEAATQEPGAQFVLPEWPTLPKPPRVVQAELQGNLCPEGFVEKPVDTDTESPASGMPESAEIPTEIDEVLAAYLPESIWTLKQSVRLEYDKPAYLDHPTMGILVLVTELPESE